MKQADKHTFSLAIIVAVACLGLGAFIYLSLPTIFEFLDATFGAGLGIKQAAPIAFGVTIIVFILFAVAAGDGLLGELQYMLGAFGLFFLCLWLGIAWVF